MSLIGRRPFLVLGLGAAGGAAIAYGGSLAACSGGLTRQAMLRPLFVALAGLVEPEKVGRAVLRAEGEETILTTLLARDDLFAAALLPGDDERRRTVARIVRDDFRSGDTLTVERWVLSRTEAYLAGAAVA
jgi:hypothetical protein